MTANAATKRAESNDVKKRYATRMGVDAAIVDIAERTKRPSMHWLSRNEIARLGIVSTGHFETPWVAYAKPAGSYVGKAVTQPSRLHPTEFTTTMLEFGCMSVFGVVTFAVLRELDRAEVSARTAVRVTAGDSDIFKVERERGPIIDIGSELSVSQIAQVIESSQIVLAEQFQTWHETVFSMRGFSEAFKHVSENCRKK